MKEEDYFAVARLVDDETGELERPPGLDIVHEDHPLVFDVADGYLRWYTDPDQTHRTIKYRPGPGMLTNFVALASPDVRDERIAAYARRWNSPLGLCPAGRAAALDGACLPCSIGDSFYDDYSPVNCYPRRVDGYHRDC